VAESQNTPTLTLNVFATRLGIALSQKAILNKALLKNNLDNLNHKQPIRGWK